MSTTFDAPAPAAVLRASDTPLVASHDAVLLDLDGVVYIGPDAVPGAAEHLEHARAAGARLVFVTNNASRPPETVAAHLSALGVPCAPDEVATSAQAAAHHLRTTLGTGARVLRIGGAGLTEALRAEGLHPVDALEEDPVAVVQGFSPDLTWRHLAEATRAVRSGLPWVATNLDLTVPVVGGPAPGNGTLVAAVRAASGVEPFVVGKPEPTLLAEAVRRSGAQRPLMVGDRLDTDLEGARRAGMPGLLVLTGVTGAAELLAASPAERPDHLSLDLGGLLSSHPAAEALPHPAGPVVRCAGAELVHDGTGWSSRGGSADPLDVLRAAAVAAWWTADASGVPAGAGLLQIAESALADARRRSGDVVARR